MLISRTSRDLVFLGGIFSAIFLALAFPPHDRRPLVWFALVPLLFSLSRQRHNLRGRVLHTLSFSLLFAGWFLWPLVPAAFVEAGRCGASTGDAAGMALLQGGVTWAVIAGSWILFAAASGPLFRDRRLWVPWLGLPLLWTGLEHLRSEVLPVSFPYLTLASGVAASTPEAQIAAALGERGLSFLVALSNASFLLVLRQRRWLPQAAFALVGCGIFLGCFLGGDLSLVPSEDVSGLRRALVVQAGRSEPQEAGDVLRSIEIVLAGDETDIALFPRDAVEAGTPHGDRLLARLRHMARHHAMEILAGESSASRRRAALDASEDASASGGGPGEDVGDGADAEEAAPQDEPAIPLGEPAIEDDEPAGGGEKRPGDGLLIIDREGRVAGGVRAASRLCSDPGSWRGEISAPAPIRMAGALVGAAVGPDFYSPAAARRLVRGGAEILLASDRDPRSWPRALARQHARMSELRAVENRRWLLRATHGGFSAFVTPQGRSIDSFSPDFSWPEIEEVELRDRLSPFTRGGWLFGPICMGLALLIAIAALFPRCWRPADEEPEGDDPRLHTERDPPPAGGS